MWRQNVINEDIEFIYSPPVRRGGSRPTAAVGLEMGWWNFTGEIF
jgi:hypothetical protein